MGRLTTGPGPFPFVISLFLCACASGGPGGGDYIPPEPLELLGMASELGVGGDAPDALFVSDLPIKLTLAADFDRLGNERSQETEEHPGQLLVAGLDGDPVELPIQVKTRGNFRLQKRICPDPPLRLNLQETVPQGTVFDGQDKLKLVVHCRDNDRYEQNLLEEYLAYRIYNHLSDMSFRVQLAEVTYLDTSRKKDPITRMAFLIEDEEQMATRLGGRMVETPTANPGDFVPDQLGLVYLYQFMVGNVDWGTGASHNMKILMKDGGYYPIPYDFDWTGLVDAPYAGPNPLTVDLHDSVRERVYWGACMDGLDFNRLFSKLFEVRQPLLNLIGGFGPLSEHNRESAADYLNEFYKIIEDEGSVQRRILRSCRK